VDDTLIEADETVVVTLSTDADYDIIRDIRKNLQAD